MQGDGACWNPSGTEEHSRARKAGCGRQWMSTFVCRAGLRCYGRCPRNVPNTRESSFPPKRNASILSPKTQEESDFLRAVSARQRCRNPTRVPSLALGGLGPGLLLPTLSGLPCPGPLRLPHPPSDGVAMWSCPDWPGPEASNWELELESAQSWLRPKRHHQRVSEAEGSWLRPQPHQTLGPCPTHSTLPPPPDSTPRCPDLPRQATSPDPDPAPAPGPSELSSPSRRPLRTCRPSGTSFLQTLAGDGHNPSRHHTPEKGEEHVEEAGGVILR